jgi:GNAT superfamily N-acetyltransferase
MGVREARRGDIPQILELQAAAYPVLASVSAWQAHHLESQQTRFPEGQLVVAIGGRVVGYSASFITTSDRAFQPHTFREITVRGSFEHHDPRGDTLYGAEMMVHPDERGQGIARSLYEARFDLARRLRLHYFAAGGRLPGYADVADDVDPATYVADVVAGKRTDRVLTPQLRSGLEVRGVLPDYLNDPKSRNYAALLVWTNPEFATPSKRRRTSEARGPRKIQR